MEKEKSLKVSFIEGFFASITFGITMNYTTPFALLLGATNYHISLLNSLPQLFSAFIQSKSADIAKKIKSRVKTISTFIFFQAISFASVVIIVFIPHNLKVPVFILLIVMTAVFGAISDPVWASLMSDTVDKDKYGRYFSWRGKVLGFVSFFTNFIAGFFLFLMPSKLTGFYILFFVAGICRIISSIYLGKMYEVPIEEKEKKDFTYFEFIKRFQESNFVKFVLFVAFLNFATFIAAPFFAVYMLKELKFEYSTYTLITSSAAVANLLTLPFWGKLADRYGNVIIIKTCAKFAPLIPLFWLVSQNPVYLIIVNAIAGYIWAGFNLSVFNFIFDANSPQIRAKCMGYFNFTNGILIFLGSMLGGYLTSHLPPLINDSVFLTLFTVSGIGRYLVVLFMAGKFKEVKPVENIAHRDMIYLVTGIKHALYLASEIYRKRT